MNQILKFDTADAPNCADDKIEERIAALLREMTLPEKIGQMRQVDATGEAISPDLADAIRTGRIGSVINQASPEIVNELQRIAVEETRLGVPLLIA
ncbi:MAG: glycoside hydrolase family 3 N-terminal domain-containing protein, partial [Pseudomonadota bacterium]